MVVSDVVLWDFALIGLFLFRQEIHGVCLLEQRIALVLLVRQDAPDVAGVPMVLPAR